MLGLWLWLRRQHAGGKARCAGRQARLRQPLRGARRRVPPPDGAVCVFGRAHLLAAVHRAEAAAQPRRGRGGRRVPAAGGAGRCRAHVVQRCAVRLTHFDFGANYNLTGNDMTQRGFNAVRIGPAVFTSLFELPSWQGVFPFRGRPTSRRTPSSARSARSSRAAFWPPRRT